LHDEWPIESLLAAYAVCGFRRDALIADAGGRYTEREITR
jgi:hypothetical protein